MASSPITSWQTDVEKVTDFIFLAPKSLWMDEIKRCLILGSKVTTNVDNILRREITLPIKV